MIKFFRRIREQLISESQGIKSGSRTSKYLFYAIGEIILVVIGILIALSINNWNQNRLDENLEYQYYKRLLEDVREEKIILQATTDYSKQVLNHANRAIAVFENAPDSNPNPLDNLIDMYQASQLQDATSASSTYKELIASGQINLIKDDSLKTTLIRYYEIDWTKTGVFELSNRYRDNLRGKIPNALQAEIRTKCGDIYMYNGNGYQTSLPETCEIKIDYDSAKTLVAILKKDESLKEDLRYLIGNETGKKRDMLATEVQLMKLTVQLEKILKLNTSI